MAISDLTDQVTSIKLNSKLSEVITPVNSTTNNLLDNYIPVGTVIKVELDGSGDFTSFSDVMTYLTGKWSTGTVTIQLGNGTFNITQQIFTINTYSFNIPYLKFVGKSKDTTILKFNKFFYIYGSCTHVSFETLTFTRTDISDTGDFIRCFENANVLFSWNISIETGPVFAYRGANVSINSDITFKDANIAIYACAGGHVHFTWGTVVKCYNVINTFKVLSNGMISLHNLEYRFDSKSSNKIVSNTTTTISTGSNIQVYTSSYQGTIAGLISSSQQIS